MRIEYENLTEIVPADRNPKGHDIPEIKNSIRRFGFVQPMLRNETTGKLLGGHGRLEALSEMLESREDLPQRIQKKNGTWLVPVIRGVGFDTDAEAEAYLLADNQLTIAGGWVDAELAEMIADIPDLTGVGFSDEEISELLSPVPDIDFGDDSGQQEEDDEIPEPPKDPITKPGDIWELGDHRLICGDCRDQEVVARLLGDARVNVAFTSPPYASQRKYDESSGFKPIPPDDYVKWFEPVQANVRKHLAKDGSWFVNIKEHCQDGQRHLYVKDLTIAHVRQWGWRFVDEFCWYRSGVPGKWNNRFKNSWEPVFHFSAENQIKMRHDSVSHKTDQSFTYSPNNPKTPTGFITHASAGESAHVEGMALPGNHLDIPNAKEGGHSAMFPVGIPCFFIRAFSDEGDAIFDPFMGSGTTMIAAERNNRRSFGIEISPAYCDVIVARFEAETGGKAKRCE